MTEQTNGTSNLERSAVPVLTELEPVKQGRSLVVTIGINEYVHWQKLKNAVQDAIGLQQTLIDKLGFSAPIPPLLNEAATKAAIESLIDDRLREELQEDDNLVLFFAGHGHTRVDKLGSKVVGETGFIVPVEARGPKEYWSDYIKIDPLLQSISRLPARHILVILDSCHSGFALGEAMKIYKSANRYEKDLSSRISRKVITSARREQLALDSGPIPGHSLFTGTLVDGFNWGKADLDGNGLITSSELGLFIQQKVGQASESRQTPDFGSFYFDDRGEMVISLRDQSFDALKNRAVAALQVGNLPTFKEHMEKVLVLKPSEPETLYLEYRLMLIESTPESLDRAWNIIDMLFDMQLRNGVIPLSNQDILNLKYLYENIRALLTIPESESSSYVVLTSGQDEQNMTVAEEKLIGERKIYLIEKNSDIQFQIKNNASNKFYVYMVKIDPEGRITLDNLWRDRDILINGLPPGETKSSYLFSRRGPSGIYERRLFFATDEISELLYPPSPNVRQDILEEFFLELIENNAIKMKRFCYFYT
jgi:hypothetical protein